MKTKYNYNYFLSFIKNKKIEKKKLIREYKIYFI